MGGGRFAILWRKLLGESKSENLCRRERLYSRHFETLPLGRSHKIVSKARFFVDSNRHDVKAVKYQSWRENLFQKKVKIMGSDLETE